MSHIFIQPFFLGRASMPNNFFSSLRGLRWHFVSLVSSLLLSGLLSGCASPHYREANSLFRQGQTDAALIELKKAYDAEPSNVEVRSEYFSRLTTFTNSLIAEARTLRQQGKSEEAQAVYERLLRVDPSNTIAKDALSALPKEKLQNKLVAEAGAFLKAGDPRQAMSLVRSVLSENPDHYEANQLKHELDELASTTVSKRLMGEMALKLPRSNPVNLEFRDANVKFVFDVLGRSSGVNFILDKDVRPDLQVTVFLRNATLEDAVKLILQTQQLEYKLLNANSVLIYPNTPEKTKVYQDLVVKAFYLQNADAKQVQANLKTMLKSKDTIIDEKLNLIVMRDTPDAIQIAEKIIAMQDLSEPEVMLEVEILEVDRSKVTNLGIQWPGSATLTPLSSNTTSGLTVTDLRNLNSSTTGVSGVSVGLNANKTITDANILANPRIRVRNRESAKIMIGDKLPVITSNVTPTGVVSSNIQYLEVGLKLDVQPDIRLKNEIGIKLALEVSSVTNTVTLANGTQTYQIGTRNAETKLRLRDGETQILGGLINDQEGTSGNRIPGIGDLPILNRLFGTQRDSHNKTELVLSITPRLVRNLSLPQASRTEFWSGTEANLRNPNTFAVADKSGNKRAGDNSAAATTNAESNVAALSAMPLEPAKTVDLSWKVTDTKGDVMTLSLIAKADGTMRSLPLQLGFDGASYQVMSVEEGGYFNRDGANTTFSHSVDHAGGKVFATVTRNDVQGAPSGELAAITLKIKSTGAKVPEIKVLAAEPVVSSGVRPVVNLPGAFNPLEKAQ
jgi:general secretion pathway protein D